MKANIKLIKKQRRYSEEFKKSIVSDFESGKFSVPQLEKLHGIHNSTIYQWIYKFSTFNQQGYRIVEMDQSSNKKVKELEDRIKELESLLGRSHIKNVYLEKLIEIAKDEYDIDILKNSNTPQSGGLGKIKEK